ncbi:MAG: preprotein translocase subunit SecY [Phycisphaerales bacterium]|nr:preprotein translocase subunit SecY [Phycisphaerales bacterium]
MLQAFFNIFRIPDLRNRVLFTLGVLIVYRIGFWVPLVGVDQSALVEAAERASDEGTGFGQILKYASIFSGGSFSQSTIFGLGIMPYITASIIFQLLQTAVPRLQELKKEGASGQQKITEWTRYATVAMCVIQSVMWLKFMQSQGLVKPEILGSRVFFLFFFFAGVTGLTAGSIFLMWLGEQIDKYGIGNGVSLILTAGIIAQMPNAIMWLANNFELSTQEEAAIGPAGILFLAAAFVFVVAGAILITVAQRRIPIQQARHTRGRKVYGGGKHYLPLRVNHAGVMPIIFASSLMIFPSAFFGYLSTAATSTGDSAEWWVSLTNFLNSNFQMGAYPYLLLEIILIYFFSYFWTTVVFSPEDMAKQLRDHGSFIPGLRPGPRTAEYLETVVERITYVGAGFLAIIAIIPTLVRKQMGIPFTVSSFLGGTGLLIVVSVGLDLIQRIEANLLMRNYAGFLSGGEQGRAGRVKSGRR